MKRLALVIAAFTTQMTPALAGYNNGGGNCIQIGSGGTLVRYFPGTIGNDHTTEWVDVLCPTTRRGGQNTTGVPIVCGIDRNDGQGFTCSFYDQRSYGHTWSWSGWKESLGSGVDNYRSLSWASSTSEDKFDGFHHFYCKIPPKTSIGVTTVASYSSGE